MTHSLIIHINQPSNPSAGGGHLCARLVRRGLLRSRARGVSRDSPAAFERRHGGLLRRFLPWKTSLTPSRVTRKRVTHSVASSHRISHTFSCIRSYNSCNHVYLTGEKKGSLQAADSLLPRAPSSQACLRPKLVSSTSWKQTRTNGLIWYPPPADG